jgi:hypothetical protein
MSTLIAAPTDASAAARAAADEIPDGEWRRVGPDPADLEGATGALLFADDWRELFPLDPTELGVQDGGASAFLAAAHTEADLLVELAS